MTKVCIYCQKEYEAERESGKFCSDKCRVKWNREKSKSDDAFPKTTLPPTYLQLLVEKSNQALNKTQEKAVIQKTTDSAKQGSNPGNGLKNDNFIIRPMQYHEILQKIRLGADISEIEAIAAVSKLTPPQRSMIQSKLKTN